MGKRSASGQQSPGAIRQARYRAKRRRELLVWSDEHQAMVNPEPHEGSDQEYKAGCGCRACLDAHAGYNQLWKVGDLDTTPLSLGSLRLADLAALARAKLNPVPTVPPPPAVIPERSRRGRHRAS